MHAEINGASPLSLVTVVGEVLIIPETKDDLP